MFSMPQVTVQVIGNIVGEPQMLPKGGVRFTVSAYDSKTKSKGYFSCFSSADGLAQYLGAGKAVVVTGRLSFEQEGNKALIPMYQGQPSLSLSFANVTFCPPSFNDSTSEEEEEEEENVPF